MGTTKVIIMQIYNDTPFQAPANPTRTRLHSRYLAAALSTILLVGCHCTGDSVVKGVRFDQDVPAGLLVDYVEQMKYLAMRFEEPERMKRVGKLEAIAERIQETRALLEKFRTKFGYRKHKDSE